MINQLKEMQNEVLNREDLKQGTGGPFNRTDNKITKQTSWCNQATFITARVTDPILAKAMYDNDDPNGDNHTNAAHIAKNLAKAANDSTSSIREVSPSMAQNLANAGVTVAGTKDVDYEGHVATVASGYDFDQENGPMMANVGGSDKHGYTRAKSAFRGTYYEDGKVHFYVNTESVKKVLLFMEIKK